MAHPPIDQQITFLSTSDLAETASFYEQIMELPLKNEVREKWTYKNAARLFGLPSSG